MRTLEYSPDASNVLDLFYGRDAVVYVEGEDDIPFWSAAFKVFASADVEVLSLGGSEELDKMIARIVADDLRVIAARDSDFTRLTGRAVIEERIVYTYGYSIENTLYNQLSVADISATSCRLYRPDVKSTREWFKDLFAEMNDLVVFDLAAHMLGKSFSVVGDNCSRLMIDQKSHLCSAASVSALRSDIASRISAREFRAAAKLLSPKRVNSSLYLKGHFLASAVQKYLSYRLKSHGRNSNLSFESMYSSSMEYLKNNFGSVQGASFYDVQINAAIDKLATFPD